MNKIEDLKVYHDPVSQSTINTALRCPRLYLYKYKWHLALKREPMAVAATLGSLFHRLMQLGPGSEVTVKTEVLERQKALMEQIKKGEDLAGDLAAEANKLTELYQKALMMAHMFWGKYPEPDYLETVADEKKITCNIKDIVGVDISLRGRIDRIVRDTRNGSLWVRDSKTSGRDISFTLTGYHYSTQCRMYRVLTALEYEAPRGFILDYVATPAIKFCRKDKDFDAYIQRCKEWYEDKDITAAVSKAIVYTENLFPEEFKDALRRVAHYDMAPADPGFFGRDITCSHCKYYEKVCPFYELCNTNTIAWPGLIEQHYRIWEREEKKDD